MSETDQEEEGEIFFTENLPPAHYDASKSKVEKFCAAQQTRGIVLVTSGGTTVPLELNTGTVTPIKLWNGKTIVKLQLSFFRKGYSVIFLHRENSLRPFSRHLPGSSMLSWLTIADGQVVVDKQNNDFVKQVLQEYKQYSDRLCEIYFTSLADYLWLLRMCCLILNSQTSRSILYLAAAVSDFYVPSQKLPRHKLQSSEGPPDIHLHIVPKMLRPLVGNWAPNCYVASFKLETDPSILISKAKQALEKYKHNLVVGNILESRKREVWIITGTHEEKIHMSEEEINSGSEIEEKIVAMIEKISEEYLIQQQTV
ncbi:phosphopantothenate--cysteine ligase [Eurytemora carolleeae]|uniref:phosphopantothenate--cysteine ligase n=1 Tax=Eurytemora carolleeae TaxID=1294199 RepID=UPI000C79173C|nr:phosphopantothenate--cysteine ligase [Eurytemora carolleeae]|eukprot:XP_023339772.1 phosphopantothenate--cysteine ligase-like [Eurytemora affinis]